MVQEYYRVASWILRARGDVDELLRLADEPVMADNKTKYLRVMEWANTPVEYPRKHLRVVG